MTVFGIFGLLAFLLLLFNVYRNIQKRTDSQEKNALLAGLGYLVWLTLLMPPSLVLLFILFLLVSLVNKQAADESGAEPAYYPLAGLVPVYVIILGLAFVFAGGSSYFLAKATHPNFISKSPLTAW